MNRIKDKSGEIVYVDPKMDRLVLEEEKFFNKLKKDADREIAKILEELKLLSEIKNSSLFLLHYIDSFSDFKTFQFKYRTFEKNTILKKFCNIMKGEIKRLRKKLLLLKKDSNKTIKLDKTTHKLIKRARTDLKKYEKILNNYF